MSKQVTRRNNDESKKKLDYVQIKKITYDALRMKGPMRFNELLAESGTFNNTLKRILNEADILGLIKKNNLDQYEWCKPPSEIERVYLQEHYRKLAPGFVGLLQELNPALKTPDEKQSVGTKIQFKTLQENAEQHLETGYPSTYRLLREYRQLDEKTQGVLKELLQHFKNAEWMVPMNITPPVVMHLDWVKNSGNEFAAKMYVRPEYYREKEPVPYSFRFNSLAEAQQALNASQASAQIATTKDGKCIVYGPLSVKQDPESLEKMIDLAARFSKDIYEIMLWLDHNQRLEGHCKICVPEH
jgi:hypothetical protein